jgi:hypothetical protein
VHGNVPAGGEGVEHLPGPFTDAHCQTQFGVLVVRHGDGRIARRGGLAGEAVHGVEGQAGFWCRRSRGEVQYSAAADC